MITIWKVRALLNQRGIMADEDKDFRLQDNSDGAGPFISEWNTGKLGSKPNEAQLSAMETEANTLRAAAKSVPPVTVSELITQMIADGTMTQAKIDAIKAAR